MLFTITSMILLYNNIPVILKIYTERVQYNLQMHQNFPTIVSLGLDTHQHFKIGNQKKKKINVLKLCFPKFFCFFF